MPRMENVPTSNRYQPLENLNDDPREERTATKAKPPPPIVIQGKNGVNTLQSTLRGIGVENYHVKYTRNNTNLYVHTGKDHKKVAELLNTGNTQYYTYTTPEEKTHAFVARGLDMQPEVSELKEELEKNGINVSKIFKLTTTVRPLYLVIMPASYRVNDLKNKAKYLLHTCVTWERHNNKKKIISATGVNGGDTQRQIAE